MPRTMLEQLLQPGALRVELQPIVTMTARGPVLFALEALTRGPRGTNMERPDVLFEYARRKGEETRIDMLCIAHALASIAGLPARPLLSINIHGSTISSVPRFASTLLETADGFGIAPRQLMLEILEHRFAWAMDSLRTTLGELREAGVRIALDDLGNGASNYHMFIDCRPDYVKIDRYVVAGCSHDPFRMAVLRSIVALCDASGAAPIAEGIENCDDLSAVRSVGIHCVQGWLFSPSLTPSEAAVSEFLQPTFDPVEKGK
jgi:EAL domain-containing protein (putative c-di-GMP-specific phosphodiesterase class I)